MLISAAGDRLTIAGDLESRSSSGAKAGNLSVPVSEYSPLSPNKYSGVSLRERGEAVSGVSNCDGASVDFVSVLDISSAPKNASCGAFDLRCRLGEAVSAQGMVLPVNPGVMASDVVDVGVKIFDVADC